MLNQVNDILFLHMFSTSENFSVYSEMRIHEKKLNNQHAFDIIQFFYFARYFTELYRGGIHNCKITEGI